MSEIYTTKKSAAKSIPVKGRYITQRTKIRKIKIARDKSLLGMYRKLVLIRQAIFNLGYEPILPPVQRGWKRIFVLRADVAEGTKADFFSALLEKINTIQYSHRKDFKRKRRKYGRKVDIDRIQHLAEIHECRFVQPRFLTEKEKSFFEKRERFDAKGKSYFVYVFSEPWRYTLKIVPNMLTHRRIVSAQLDSDKARLNGYLDANCLWPHIYKLLYGYYYGNYKENKKRDVRKLRRINPLNDLNSH
ncbi:MAG: hypothetical protein IM638_19825 [Bacteroidetes bacterium]|nr:hypothetical protein [Bacteroidota bacterium]